MSRISQYVTELRACCPSLSAVWVIGDRADGAAPDSGDAYAWDLVGFGDFSSLESLRSATHLHRSDVRVRIVTDGNSFAAAWGELPGIGSLFQWDWVQANEGEAFYSESRWQAPAQALAVERRRRKAVCVWRAGASAQESPR